MTSELAGGNSAQASYTLAANEALWWAIPEGLRRIEFTEATIPEEHRGAFLPPAARPSGIRLEALPPEMQRELAWCIFRTVELGETLRISAVQTLVCGLAGAVDNLRAAPMGRSCSLMTLPLGRWEHEIAAATTRLTRRLPAREPMRAVMVVLRRCYQLLSLAYDPGPWWRRQVWDPTLDDRIPRRVHEPLGRNLLYFHRIEAGWLRLGAQWHCRVCLETGQLRWSSLASRVSSLVAFDRFLTQRQVTCPWLCDEAREVRALMLDFLSHLREFKTQTGSERGKPVSSSRVNYVVGQVESFYSFMAEHRETAASALGEPGWLRLGPQHATFYHRGEKRYTPVCPNRPTVIDDTAFSKIMANLHLLGDPLSEGGLGDEQAMRIVMLLARTGRRVHEILMLDRDPLLPIDGLTQAKSAGEGDGLVAKLRYQQTKIDGAPDSIFVDEEVVAIVKTQQGWADRFLQDQGLTVTPKYLFLAVRGNRRADVPYTFHLLRKRLARLVERLDIRDDQGRLVDFRRTHRFRHTLATSLLNAGVPIHVVQRHLGHLSPTMTMAYAKTLSSTHEREFLRFKKLGADARELEVDPRDLYNLLELNHKADRILPNGWCMLPPRQVCTKGNACLTCDKFATDASYVPELTQQLERTDALIEDRRQAFRARTGQEMGEDNVWLAGRHQEQGALRQILLTIGRGPAAEGTAPGVRGAGVAARHEQILADEPRGS